MKLRSVHLTNVRRFAGKTARLDDIGDGITVFCAPNESGKSTFFDALHALFFQPYGSQNREVKLLQPHSGGAVTVAAEIEAEDRHYRVEKTWLNRKSARVFDRDTGRLIAQDDEAEAWIQRLIAGGLSGPAGLLWVRQGVTSFDPGGTTAADKREWESALEARRDLMSSLAGEIDLMTGGRRMDHVLCACRAELADLATTSGRPKAGGPWKRAEDEVEGLRKTRDTLASQVAELAAALAERRRAEAERARLDEPEERAARERALKAARAAMQAAEEHAARLEAADREVRIARLEKEAAEATAEELRGLEQTLLTAQAAVAAASAEEARAQEVYASKTAEEAKAADTLAAAEACVKELRAAHGRAQRAAMARLATERLGEMRVRLQKAEELSQRLARARAELEAARVDDKTLTSLEDAYRQLTEAEARRDALAVTVTPRYSSKLRITIEGHELPEGTVRALHGPTLMDLPGLGRLEVDTGGRTSAESARAAFELAERTLRALLDSAGVMTISEARAARTIRQKAEAEATQTANLLANLAPDGVDRLREQVAALALSAQTREEDAEAGVPDAIAERLEAAEGQQVRARAELDAVRMLMARADNALSAARTAHRLARDAFASARSALGTEPQHAERTAQAADRVRQATQTLTKANDVRDALAKVAPDTTTLRAELARTEGAVKAAADRMRTLSDQISGLDGLIRARAEDGIEEKFADVEGRLQTGEARASRYAHEAAALQRLTRALEDARHAARDAYFEPVKAELLPLLSLLHEEADIRLDDTSLLPVALTRQGQEEEIDILSGGTAEQIAILTRLAFARLFARDGRSVPVILDDALIHSDDDRIERMFTALHRVAGDQQILVFTCRQRAFSRLGGAEARFAIELA
jgi:DNA repair exonuclease SbcCD ATPase subunit